MQADVLRTPSGFLKLVEIAFTIIIISVTVGVKNFTFIYEARAIFCGGVLVMAMVVTPLMLLVYLMGHAREMHAMPLEMRINAVLAAFMLSAGALIIDTAIKLDDLDLDFTVSVFGRASNAGKTGGAFAILNCVVYAIDTFFAKQSITE